MNNQSKIIFSVIIPVYNRSLTISTAINSVLNQSFFDFELLIIDDGSTDNTLEVISTFSDSRIKLLKMSVNSGAAAARNFGIKSALGQYISFLDSDDTFEPDFLKVSYETINPTNNRIGFMWTGLNRIENNNVIKECWKPTNNKNSYFTFLSNLHIGTNSGITVKKEVFIKCGYFNEKLEAAEDTDFFLRISQHYDYIFSTKYLMNVYRDGKDRLSKNLKKNAKAYQLIFPQHKEVIDTSQSLKQKYYYKMMWLSFYLPNRTQGTKYFFFLIRNKIYNLKIILIYLNYLILPLSLSSFLHRKISTIK